VTSEKDAHHEYQRHPTAGKRERLRRRGVARVPYQRDPRAKEHGESYARQPRDDGQCRYTEAREHAVKGKGDHGDGKNRHASARDGARSALPVTEREQREEQHEHPGRRAFQYFEEHFFLLRKLRTRVVASRLFRLKLHTDHEPLCLSYTPPSPCPPPQGGRGSWFAARFMERSRRRRSNLPMTGTGT